MSKRALLENLRDDVYVRLGRGLHGVGVLAVRKIPKRTYPFATANNMTDVCITLSETEVKSLPKPVRKLIDDFCIHRKGLYFVPKHGMNGLSCMYYMNHSDKPNIDIVSLGDEFSFSTNRIIKVGEELTIDYKVYDE